MIRCKNIFCNIFVMLLIAFCIVMIDDNAYAASIKLDSDYISTGDYNSYYYNQLNDDAKVIYDKLLKNVNSMLSGNYTISINYSSATVLESNIGTIFQSAIDAFDRDHPEIFWIALNKLQLSYTVTKVGNISFVRNVRLGLSQSDTDVKEGYLLPQYGEPVSLSKDVELFKNEVNNVITNADKTSTMSTVKSIHDWLVVNNDYNCNEVIGAKAYKAISAFDVESNGEDSPVCEGYARAFKVICDKLQIPCIIASGEASLNNTTQGHMWNYVKVDGHWYAIDITWDDPILGEDKKFEDLSYERKYLFFLVGTDSFYDTHSPSGMFASKEDYDFCFIYPLISKSNYNTEAVYYKLNVIKRSGGTIYTNASDCDGIEEGSFIVISIIPDEGMEIVPDSLRINGIKLSEESFEMPARNSILSVKFMKSDAGEKVDNEKTPASSSTDNKVKNTKKPKNTANSKATEKASSKTTSYKKKTVATSSAATSKPSIKTIIEKKKFLIDISNKKNNNDIDLSNSGDDDISLEALRLSTSEDGVLYELSDGIFTEDVYVEIADDNNPNDELMQILERKFGDLAGIDTCIFDILVTDYKNENVRFVINDGQYFIIFVPIDEKMCTNTENLNLYYLNDKQLIAVDSEICKLKDGFYYKVEIENAGKYIIVNQLAIEENETCENVEEKSIVKAATTGRIKWIVVLVLLLFAGIGMMISAISKRKHNTDEETSTISTDKKDISEDKKDVPKDVPMEEIVS